MVKERRLKAVKQRKNFLPTLVLIIGLWGFLVLTIFFLDPDIFGVVFLFFIIFFMASFFTFSMLFANTRRGLLSATALSFFVILRYLGVGNILNLFLIGGLLVTIELYFHFTKT